MLAMALLLLALAALGHYSPGEALALDA